MHVTLARTSRTPRRQSKRLLEKILSAAGVELNGQHPFDLRVLNDAFYDRVRVRGLQGALEAYVDGWWESDRLDELTAPRDGDADDRDTVILGGAL